MFAGKRLEPKSKEDNKFENSADPWKKDTKSYDREVAGTLLEAGRKAFSTALLCEVPANSTGGGGGGFFETGGYIPKTGQKMWGVITPLAGSPPPRGRSPADPPTLP